MDLNPELVRSIHEYGFQAPTKLQQDALPRLIQGYDMVMDAPVNSGKTTTSCISVLQKIDTSNLQCQALILTPSVGTTLRTLKIILALCGHNIHCHFCVDQADFREDDMRLKKGAQIVVGTPSSVQEIIKRGALATRNIRMIVLDRVDEMFLDGFKDVIDELFQSIPRSAQVVFLLSKSFVELRELTTKFMRNPECINHDTEEADIDDGETLSGSARQSEEMLFGIESKREEAVSKVDGFDSMNLKSELLRGIHANGFKRKSPVQQRAIDPILKNQDVIIQAQSGTDRIAAVSIAILQKIDTSSIQCQVLFLVPTPELSYHIHEVIMALGSFTKIQCHVCFGGVHSNSIREDAELIRRGSQVVVGTLGRIYDLIDRRIFKTDSFKLLVVDDEILNQLSMDKLRQIQQLAPNIQLVFLSATSPNRAMTVGSNLNRELSRIVVKKDQLPLKDIKQYYVAVEKEEFRLGALYDLCEKIETSHIVIFCCTRRKVRELTGKLAAKDLSVSALNDSMEEIQREVVMEAFNSGSSRILILTDLQSYSVDVQHVSLVINYDLPIIKEDYNRRVGLAGRFGREGAAINIVLVKEIPRMRKIEQIHSTQISEMSVEDTLP
ncbi:MAG: P-loop containing nucleoside triphosphate hydrolase protein [Benniella sp.]|nr:MAG: P-loop containing nucleoside triphosphate hydrolase protein [Benniella sp.]